MAVARLLAPWVGEESRSAIYHCVSRVVNREFVFGEVEKEAFVEMMRLYEEFCGVRVLSYCVMSNHFHLLVEVPPRMDDLIDDAELVRRMSLVASDQYVAQMSTHLERMAQADTEEGVAAYDAYRGKILARMWDLGAFMKVLKQRFTRWFNARHARKGTLWEERYKSVLVENGHAARVMAAYIDLNPVRAGMVKDPKDYRWCSYAAAVAGSKRVSRGDLARRGIARIMDLREHQGDDDSEYDGWVGYVTPEHYGWRSISGRYRLILFEDGVEVINTSGRSQSKSRRGVTEESLKREESRDGELSLAEVLRCKTRYFVDGGVIGEKSFVRRVVGGLRGNYLSSERVSNGRKIPNLASAPHGGRGGLKSSLWSMRQVD